MDFNGRVEVFLSQMLKGEAEPHTDMPNCSAVVSSLGNPTPVAAQ
jgi:hypothetical protein